MLCNDVTWSLVVGDAECVCTAGVSHVKWSKFNLLATAHESDVRIWDPRVSDINNYSIVQKTNSPWPSSVGGWKLGSKRAHHELRIYGLSVWLGVSPVERLAGKIVSKMT